MQRTSGSKVLRALSGAAVSVAAMLMLSGCISVNREYHATAYSPAYVAYVSRDGSMPMEIFGNPFGDDAEADAKLISTINLSALHGSKPARPVSAKDRADGHRLVMVFNPTNKRIDGRKLCAMTKFETAASADTVVIQAALCSHSDVISEARVVGPAAASPDDGPFQDLMYQLLTVMLPGHEGARKHECSIRNCA
jgi:hypothetical protein